MDDDVRDLHRQLHPERRRPEENWRKGTVVAFDAGPPRTATVTIGNGTNEIPGVPLMEYCAAGSVLTPGDDVWLTRHGSTWLIQGREG